MNKEICRLNVCLELLMIGIYELYNILFAHREAHKCGRCMSFRTSLTNVNEFN